MQVAVKLYSIFRRYARGTPFGRPLMLELGRPATVHTALVVKLGIPADQIYLVMRNGQRSSLDEPLDEGDELLVFPPVGGG